MPGKRPNAVLLEWQRIAPDERDASPEGLARTKQEKIRFADGVAFVLRRARKRLGKRRHRRWLRELQEFRATFLGVITPSLMVRRALELFRNSNSFLRAVESRFQDKPGSAIRIRLPVDVPADLER